MKREEAESVIIETWRSKHRQWRPTSDT